jgi:hypothetical protein
MGPILVRTLVLHGYHHSRADVCTGVHATQWARRWMHKYDAASEI